MSGDINCKAFKSGVWYTACNFVIKTIGFITTPIFTRLLTQAEFGLYNNYTSWISLFSIFVTLNLEASLISARQDYEDKFHDFIYSLALLTLTIGSIWTLVIVTFQNSISLFTGIDNVYLYTMAYYCAFIAIINLYQARERYEYGYKKTILVSTVLTLSTTLLSVLLVVILPNRLFGRICGVVVPSLVIGVVLFLLLYNKCMYSITSYWKYAITICLPYIPHILAGSVLGSMDRVMIQRYCGSEYTALYSLAYNCGIIVTVLTQSVNSAFSPWLIDKLIDNKIAEIKKVSKVYAAAFVYATVGIMLVAPEILLFLGGKDYRAAVFVITPIIMGCVCQFLYTMYANLEQIKKKTLGMAIGTMIAALINYLLNYAFIPRYGYIVAAYTTLVGYLILLLIHMYLVKTISMGHIYSNKHNIFLAIVGIAIMSFVSFSYTVPTVRVVAVIIYGLMTLCILFKYRKWIYRSLRGKRND